MATRRYRPYHYRVQNISHRYGDVINTFVIRIPDTTTSEEDALRYRALAQAIEQAQEYEINELPSYCEEARENDDHDLDDCQLCTPQIVAGVLYGATAGELFTAETLREHRRALVQGKVVTLYP